MGGNVWELVNDWYGPYDPKDIINPVGPAEGTSRVIRGGAFNSVSADNIRTARRSSLEPAEAYFAVGFRCARSLPG